MRAEQAFENTKNASADHQPLWLIDIIAEACKSGRTSVKHNDFQKEKLTDFQVGWLKTNGYAVEIRDSQWVDFNNGSQGTSTVYTISWA